MTSETRMSPGGAESKQDLEVEVSAPRVPDPKTFTWSKHMRVSEATADAARAFGYTGESFSLVRNGVALDPDKQLVAAGVRDGDKLRLLDTGGGV
jgi:hypothetical protein